MKKLHIIFFQFTLAATILCILFFFLYFHFFFADAIRTYLEQTCIKHHCLFQGTVTKSHIFYPKILLHNVEVLPLNSEDWSWRASKIECTFSLLRLFTFWSIPVSVVVDVFRGKSVLRNDQTLAILDFLLLFDDASSHFFKPYVHVMYTQNAEMNVQLVKFAISMLLKFHGRLFIFENQGSDLTATIIDGQIKHASRDQTFISFLSGIVHYMRNKEETKMSLQTKGICTDSQESIYFKGTSENASGRFSLSTNHSDCFLDPIIYTKQSSKLSGQVSLSFIQKIFHKQEGFNGVVTLQIASDHTKKNDLRGQLVFQDLGWYTKRLCSSAKIAIFSQESTVFGPISIKTELGDFFGNFSYEGNAKIGKCTIKKKSEGRTLIFPFIALDNDSFDITCTLNGSYLSAQTKCTILDTLKHKTYASIFDVMMAYSDGLHIAGSIDTLSVTALAMWKKERCGLFSLREKDKEVAYVKTQQNQDRVDDFSGFVETNIVKAMSELCSFPIPFYGEGIISFCGTKQGNSINTACLLEGGVIDIPYIHNFLIHANSVISFDFQKKKIAIREVNTLFSKGSIRCCNGEIVYDKNWSIQNCLIPITMTRCAISPHNFFDSIVSSSFSLSKEKNKTNFFLTGNILLHKGFIKNEELLKKFFSQEHNFLHSRMQIDHAIDVKTENPVTVDIKQIKTDISIKLMSSGQLDTPHLQGSIVCHNGEVRFPYKSLYITQGKILFSGGDFSNATLELFARNSIKNYRISMRATGSLLQHHIFFDATPTLSQSQISSLLLFGSLQDNVSIFMPSLFSHTVKLGSFDIHFVPGFSDKSGRGGIRGVLEIGINNRLRATIQKNFTLSEDTRFELEYAITDIISVRAVRDERRDFGGELELRWKF